MYGGILKKMGLMLIRCTKKDLSVSGVPAAHGLLKGTKISAQAVGGGRSLSKKNAECIIIRIDQKANKRVD